MLNITEYKKHLMAGSDKTEQFLNENMVWKRLLYFFVHENNSLKTRLSEVVDRETDKLFIANAEQFQNEFILKDECILDIGIDIKKQEKDLQEALGHKKEPGSRTFKMQDKLRNEMSNLEKECTGLINRFNKYLLSVV